MTSAFGTRGRFFCPILDPKMGQKNRPRVPLLVKELQKTIPYGRISFDIVFLTKLYSKNQKKRSIFGHQNHQTSINQP